jgi:hypothetical protein
MHRRGALASLCCHSPTFVPLLHPLLLCTGLFLIGCCVSPLFHQPPESTIVLYIFFSFFTSSPQKRMVSAFHCAPHSSQPPSIVPLFVAAYCWLVVACSIIPWRPPKAMMYVFIFLFFYFSFRFVPGGSIFGTLCTTQDETMSPLGSCKSFQKIWQMTDPSRWLTCQDIIIETHVGYPPHQPEKIQRSFDRNL